METSALRTLDVEQPIPRSGTDKQQMTYDASLARILAAGYGRHLRPYETFIFFMQGLEGKLSAEQQKLHADLFSNRGEWLSCAVQRKDGHLIFYQEPEGLVWDGSRYVTTDFRCTHDWRVIDDPSMPSEQPIPIREFGPGIVNFLCGWNYEDLPAVVQQKTSLTLPPEGVVWPLGRCGFSHEYNLNSHYYKERASRGVRAPFDGHKRKPYGF